MVGVGEEAGSGAGEPHGGDPSGVGVGGWRDGFAGDAHAVEVHPAPAAMPRVEQVERVGRLMIEGGELCGAEGDLLPLVAGGRLAPREHEHFGVGIAQGDAEEGRKDGVARVIE